VTRVGIRGFVARGGTGGPVARGGRVACVTRNSGVRSRWHNDVRSGCGARGRGSRTSGIRSRCLSSVRIASSDNIVLSTCEKRKCSEYYS
jgi:hypothetical protein